MLTTISTLKLFKNYLKLLIVSHANHQFHVKNSKQNRISFDLRNHWNCKQMLQAKYFYITTSQSLRMMVWNFYEIDNSWGKFLKTNPPRPNKPKLKSKAFLSKHFECFKIVKSEHPGCDVSLHGASCPWLAYCLKQTYKTTQPRTSCHTSICKCIFYTGI